MFSIAPYRVVVLNEDGKTTSLWSEGNKRGLSTWVYDTLFSKLGTVRQHTEIRRSRISRLSRNASGDMVSGIIQTGVNGYASEIVNTDTNQVSHHRTVVEAEFVPFFFLLVCPPGRDFGLLLLQRFGNLGVKDFFVDPIIEKFGQDHANSRLRITRLVPSDLAHQLLEQSIIKTIRLVRYEELAEVSDSLGEGYAERTGVVEMVFRAKKSGSLPSAPGLIQALLGKKAINQVFSVENFDYDSIKVDVEVNGKRRVIDIGRPNVLTPNIDVTEDLKLDIGGHPTWESLVDCFSAYAKDTFKDEKIELKVDTTASQDHAAEPLLEEA